MTVASNIYNTGVMDNEGLITGDVTNAANATLTTALDTIDGTLTNEGYLNTYGALKQDEEDFEDDKKLFGGTVNLVGSSTVTTSDVKLANVNLSSDLEVSKELKADNLTVTEDGELIVDGTGKITGQVANSGVVTNNGTFNAAFENNGSAQNNNVINGDVTNNSFLYNNAGASITSDITNNGSIENLSVISGGNLTNNGIVYNRTTNPDEGIIDTEISNSGILINSGSITNTVTDSAVSDPSISNSHTILNYGDVQAKNFTNAGTIHNLGVMGDNTSNDETIATTTVRLITWAAETFTTTV